MSNLNQHSSGRVHLSLLWRLWTQRRGATFCLVRSSPCRPQRMGNVLGSMSQKQSIQVVARDPEISFLVKSFDLNTTSQYIYIYVYVYVYTHTHIISISIQFWPWLKVIPQLESYCPKDCPRIAGSPHIRWLHRRSQRREASSHLVPSARKLHGTSLFAGQTQHATASWAKL